jgi:hypothetical protein
MKTCTWCSAAPGKLCGACGTYRYCSKGCQKAHWQIGHKSECKFLGKIVAPTSEIAPRTRVLTDTFLVECILHFVSLVSTDRYKSVSKPWRNAANQVLKSAPCIVVVGKGAVWMYDFFAMNPMSLIPAGLELHGSCPPGLWNAHTSLYASETERTDPPRLPSKWHQAAASAKWPGGQTTLEEGACSPQTRRAPRGTEEGPVSCCMLEDGSIFIDGFSTKAGFNGGVIHSYCRPCLFSPHTGLWTILPSLEFDMEARGCHEHVRNQVER